MIARPGRDDDVPGGPRQVSYMTVHDLGMWPCWLQINVSPFHDMIESNAWLGRHMGLALDAVCDVFSG